MKPESNSQLSQSIGRAPEHILSVRCKQAALAGKVIVLLVFLFVGGNAADVMACPNCKASIAGSNGMAVGFAWSIVMMIAVPFSILTAWAVAIRRHLKRFR